MDVFNYECPEQMNLFDFIGEDTSIDKKIRLIELFAGYGSQAMALKRLGADFEHYRVVEFDKHACNLYNKVHKTNFEPTDICDVKGVDLGIVDKAHFTYLLTYSFPCTDLSLAGKQLGMAEGSGTRSSLLWEVQRLLDECDELPNILVMENVTQVHSEKNMPHFRKWLDFLDDKGYTTFYQDMNAKNFGVAQNRDRTIVVSILGKNKRYKFPREINLRYLMKNYLDDEVDEKFYINNERSEKMLKDLIDRGQLE
jgi:DNA (cytosine-5)-methyltransferase 1